jgi:hypothetical protein
MAVNQWARLSHDAMPHGGESEQHWGNTMRREQVVHAQVAKVERLCSEREDLLQSSFHTATGRAPALNKRSVPITRP